MLLKVLRRLAGSAASPAAARVADVALLERAHGLAHAGDTRGAIKAYREYLEAAADDVAALNGLGACLADIGDIAQAAATFELAYAMDDTFIPAMVNRAKLLIDHNRAVEAMPLLERAKICQPNFLHTDAVYAGLCLKQGLTERARAFQIRSWMANFDNLRLANCYLFWTAYDDVDETVIAAEHRFWAETLQPPSVHLPEPVAAFEPSATTHRRLRIGYWSPDFRSHSVRYFFRPLLDAHDRERFEVILYHDFPTEDGHTQAVREKADQFHPVFEKSDAELCQLIRSHDLDVLVELAGHTSNNRVSLLHHRMARVQLTALGYPLTTGLPTVDRKLLDRHVSTPGDARYYSEQGLVLSTSFWCFDPKEPVAIAPEPPLTANGYVTFGCVGNIAKITDRMLAAWVRILAAVPQSRLLIRSISFEDPIATEAIRATLDRNGVPMERVDLRPPEGGVKFFSSYDGIDIILDTFPFNGGTTTCFSAYMGVPVVTLSGRSLLSRMGLSMMANLGMPDLAADSFDDYVERAIALAREPEKVRLFKREARQRFLASALGDAAQFAREFEAGCEAALLSSGASEPAPSGAIAVLPPADIVRRAYAVLRHGQEEAAQRIVDHCLREYPGCAAAHLFVAQQMTARGQAAAAIDYLTDRLPGFSAAEQVSARIALVRTQLLLQRRDRAAGLLSQLDGPPIEDSFDALQVQLFKAALSAMDGVQEWRPESGVRSILVIVPTDSPDHFDVLRQWMQRTCACPPDWQVEYRRCDEDRRAAVYGELARLSGFDWVLILQPNARPLDRSLFVTADAALQHADIVGFAGARRWTRVDWRLDDFEQKCGAFCTPCYENAALHELQVVGTSRDALAPGMAVLDGTLLALRPSVIRLHDCDEDLIGCETLLEEVWSHQAARRGARLAVHRGLGVFVDPGVELATDNRAEARLKCARTFGLDPFAVARDDPMALSVPVADIAEAARVCRVFTGQSS